MSELIVGKKFETKVNFRKLIKDIREQYPYDPLYTLIIETFANSIDAGADKIEIFINKNGDTYIIKDNGRGMTDYEFKEYHNIASLTKTKGKGIGFAGIGAKVYLDRAEYIITETKSKGFFLASRWRFRGDYPTWEVIPTQGRVNTETGTYVEVRLGRSDEGKLTPEKIEKIIQEHYNAILLGFYGKKELKINGKKISPWQPKEVEHKYNFSFKIGKHQVRGFFIKAKEKVPEEFQGVSIVVFGKTIVKQEWFKQFASSSETITGLVLADHLIKIVNTSKTQLSRTTFLWRKFHAKMSLEFSQWLEKIGVKLSPPKISSDMRRMIEQLEKSINQVLLNTPELMELANAFFQNILKRDVSIRSQLGALAGTEIEGSQITSGTLTGPGIGSGVKTIGDENGKAVKENKIGSKSIERVRRRIKSGIKIGFYNKPDNPSEGWLDPASQTITVNVGHPAYKIACSLSIEGGMYHVWIYHLLRVITDVLTKETGGSLNVKTKFLDAWYENSIHEEIKRQINKYFPITETEYKD